MVLEKENCRRHCISNNIEVLFICDLSSLCYLQIRSYVKHKNRISCRIYGRNLLSELAERL